MAAVAGPLTRSRIEAFDQTADVLMELAERLRAASPRLQQAATVYVEQIHAPNGTEWEGETATRFSQEAQPDQRSVNRAVEHANAMADIAQRGGEYLRGARESTLEAITQAEADDFTVGEDLSVTDNRVWGSPAQRVARQAAAEAHRTYIAHWAARLEAANTSIAAQLNAGAAEMTALVPAHWRGPHAGFARPAPRGSAAPENRGKVRAVDRIFKRDGGPEPTLPADDAAGDAARRYAQAQRAVDQALVDQAKAQGRTAYLPGMENQPGYMSQEEADAAARLRDYTTITDPNSPIALHGGADARRFAGERLDDYNKSKFVGPLPTDTVLGGDARTQAQARMRLQHDLENGNTSWHQQPMLPDEATRLIDTMQANDRAHVLTHLQQQLQQQGLSQRAAEQVVEGFTHGVIPQEYVDAASAASKPFEAGEHALDNAADLLDHGKHWVPEVKAFTPEDIETLKKVAKGMGGVGSALEWGTALYEISEGKPVGEVLSKAAGGWAGATSLGWLGAEGGAAFAGPPGAFVGALILGTIGGLGGDELGKQGYEWLTH